jgi:hypothetical protein
MRTIVLLLLLLGGAVAIDARQASAEVYRPWCAQYTGSRGGGTNCGFTSYEQCRMTATPGSGAVCVRNPWYEYYGARSSGRTRYR